MQLTKKAQEMIMRRTMLNSSLRKIKMTSSDEVIWDTLMQLEGKISQLKEDWIDWLQDELLEAETSSWIIGYLKGLGKECPPMLIKQNERTIVRVSDLQNAIKIIADASHPQTAGSNEPSVLEDK